MSCVSDKYAQLCIILQVVIISIDGYIEGLFCIDCWQLLIIDVERFAGLNVHGFTLTEIFTEMLLCCKLPC